MSPSPPKQPGTYANPLTHAPLTSHVGYLPRDPNLAQTILDTVSNSAQIRRYMDIGKSKVSEPDQSHDLEAKLQKTFTDKKEADRLKEECLKALFIFDEEESVVHSCRFSDTEKRVKLYRPNWANKYRVSEAKDKRFAEFIMVKRAEVEYSPIAKIIDIKHEIFEDTIPYAVYEVERANGKISFFCDNDLSMINPPDLLVLAKHLRGILTEQVSRNHLSFSRVRECMRAFLDYRRVTDLQLAMENNIQELSITKPNFSLPDIEGKPFGLIVSHSENGIFGVIVRHRGEKGMFRVTESNKFSDRLLRIIRDHVNIQRNIEGNSDDVKSAALKIFKHVNTTLKLRDLCRSLQAFIQESRTQPIT